MPSGADLGLAAAVDHLGISGCKGAGAVTKIPNDKGMGLLDGIVIRKVCDGSVAYFVGNQGYRQLPGRFIVDSFFARARANRQNSHA
jgi:hypothetical protein